MALLTNNKDTKHLLRSDIDFLLHLISDVNLMKTFPLTTRGRSILLLLWKDNKSFTEIAKQLSLSKARVLQIYNMDIRRLSYFIDTNFKEVSDLKIENKALKKENRSLLDESKKNKRKDTKSHHA